MKRKVPALLFGILLAIGGYTASAQVQQPHSITGSVTNHNDAVTLLCNGGESSALVYVSSGLTGTPGITVQVAPNIGTPYAPIAGTYQAPAYSFIPQASAASNTISASPGALYVVLASAQYVRAQYTTATSGTASVTITCSQSVATTSGAGGATPMPGSSGYLALYPSSSPIPIPQSGFANVNLDSVFNVMTFGAKCDGATDDSTAILAANTAASNAGGILYFPHGQTCFYNSATPINIGLLESVDGRNAVLLGGTSTTDGFTFAVGNHYTGNYSFFPTIYNFGAAAIHFTAKTSYVQGFVPTIRCNSTPTAAGIGVEVEAGITGNGTLSNVLTGGTIFNCNYAFENVAHLANANAQGNTFNFNFASGNCIGIYNHTDSGSVISPTNFTVNTFNIQSIDNTAAEGVCTTQGIVGDTNWDIVGIHNVINMNQFFGGSTGTPIVFNGGGSFDIQIVGLASAYSGIGEFGWGFNTGPSGATPPPVSTGTGGAGIQWNYTNGQSEADIISLTPQAGTAFKFYAQPSPSPSATPVLLFDLGSGTESTSTLYTNVTVEATASPGSGRITLGASGGAIDNSILNSGALTYNSAAGGSHVFDIAGTQSVVINGSGIKNAHLTSATVSGLCAGNSAVMLQCQVASYPACSATNTVPCTFTISCSISSGTTCNSTATVPAGASCHATADGSDTTTGVSSWKLSLSSTTLTGTVTTASSQTSTTAHITGGCV